MATTSFKTPEPFEKTRLPQIGTKEHEEWVTAFDPNKPLPKPRSLWEQYNRVLRFSAGNQDPETPTVGEKILAESTGWFDKLTAPLFPLRPEVYRDAYLRNNPCPEEHFVCAYRWPLYRVINPKIPPPVDGKYNDFYHYYAYKYWFYRERCVYTQHVLLLREMLERCVLKEGVLNGPKNCRHLFNKWFSMSRMEELNQNLLYMAVTGNCAIRETPYPEDFVEQKRKVYDDWLFRTRMKKPGDNY